MDLPDASATDYLGQVLARSSPGGGRVALPGGLGVGKTSLVRACVRALGECGVIRSPSYTLSETYTPQGHIIHHLDLYRLDRHEDMSDLGLRDLSPGVWCFVEWPERIPFEFGFDLTIALDLHNRGRSARLTGHTEHGALWLESLTAEFKLNMK